MFGNDLLIYITGGSAHIGAITFVTSTETKTLIDPPHKEGIVTEIVAKIFKNKLPERRIVVVSGIHYDSISKTEIDRIIDECRLWAENTADDIWRRSQR